MDDLNLTFNDRLSKVCDGVGGDIDVVSAGVKWSGKDDDNDDDDKGRSLSTPVSLSAAKKEPVAYDRRPR